MLCLVGYKSQTTAHCISQLSIMHDSTLLGYCAYKVNNTYRLHLALLIFADAECVTWKLRIPFKVLSITGPEIKPQSRDCQVDALTRITKPWYHYVGNENNVGFYSSRDVNDNSKHCFLFKYTEPQI